MMSPTPWKIDERGNVVDANGEYVCAMFVGGGSSHPKNRKACEINTPAIVEAVNAAAHLPINGSGTRVWPGKVQWVRRPCTVVNPHLTRCKPKTVVDQHTVVSVGEWIQLILFWCKPTDCFDTEAEAMDARKGAE